jgi:8-amino-7-oxononanoate synthase
MGTLGKAFGLAGAFVAGEPEVARLLTSRARSLLYTTAQPPALAVAAHAAVDVVEHADDRRRALTENIALFKRLAASAGVPLIDSDTAIQPVPIGPADRTMEVSRRLWDEGLFVQGIRPPTVPEGTSRLRVTLTAAHEPNQIERLVAALGDALGRTEELG